MSSSEQEIIFTTTLAKRRLTERPRPMMAVLAATWRRAPPDTRGSLLATLARVGVSAAPRVESASAREQQAASLALVTATPAELDRSAARTALDVAAALVNRSWRSGLRRASAAAIMPLSE